MNELDPETVDITPLVRALAIAVRESMADARRGLDVLEELVPGITAMIQRELTAELARGDHDGR